MLTHNTVSIQSIIARIYRDLNLQQSDRDIDFYEWISDALLHIGVYGQFKRNVEEITIEDYQGCLPSDLYKIEQIAYGASPLEHSTGTFNDDCLAPLDSYTVNAPYIRVKFRDGTIKVAYTSIQTDDDGFPLIPDEVSYKEALFFYCGMKLNLALLYANRPNSYPFFEQRWHWYCGQAKAKAKSLNNDQMQSLGRSWNKLIADKEAYKDFFRTLGRKETF